eukprot:gnl/TRDRNA2_/TRDRNA2_132548_c2_seq1.p1 gnl/TRDRNA2_/TRDRNA2_132548_c2~~gnl/TRDRNA2_/TRDRNA2_132548_c2_seq1.p1  ORF type:complete len:117 (+),score=3.08 gnl/TRDRNA2_/TRDRNA2_132548_c2_seq1:78-428(+)
MFFAPTRSRTKVVESMPLGFMDATTLRAEDLIEFQSSSSIYFAKYHPRHQWYYFPRMTPDEVVLIKTWDSHGNLFSSPQASRGISSLSLHSAFVDPYSLINSPGRVSIEVRVAVVY